MNSSKAEKPSNDDRRREAAETADQLAGLVRKAEGKSGVTAPAWADYYGRALLAEIDPKRAT